MEQILSFAKVKGWRTGENPALWKDNLNKLLPKRKKLQRGKHKALPYDDAPSFFSQLMVREAVAAKALAFTMLTAARSQESLRAKWPEIDFARKIWTCPGVRMKGGVEHDVPLSEAALAILNEMKEAPQGGDYIFPGQKPKSPISSGAVDNLLKGRMKVTNATIHGFRSTFRDWCGDKTGFPREVAEVALAHKVGNEVEQAYRRSDALEKRRKLMQAWADYLTGAKVKARNVVNFEEARKQA
jgi:integrase